MRNRTAFTVLCCILAAVGVGCASPRSDFYTLSSSAKTAPAAAGYSVTVGPVSVPEIVDRPQIVVRTGPNQVFIDEFHRWGSPLRDDIARGIAGNLAALLGAPQVSVFPHPTSSAAKYRAAVDVMVFDSTLGESAVLDAVWGIRGAGDGAIRSGRTTVRETVSDDSYAALVAAHSRALEKLSRDIADAIRGLEHDGRQK
ncbi:membrane integrity-associated transporter subunit PqiC [Candidatus Deferrimicrobium sp.]|uniref:PqiC family protein n=1 Tax=Candidatus Deferrimicrobium sp. TaxID=3060586 RepID=UPI0027179D59|nr:PqiC family protein [Candidatus Deferrimicrobium sp.]MDO8738682.1 PqiC family protein [Candidatus Deferrimicrobium sp.]